MPIATRGAVKGVTPDELSTLGAEIILANTYHLLLSPGASLLRRFGGLHPFMGWRKPILTDSGGFQVFSLAAHRKITERGVQFRDPKSGKAYRLTPEDAILMQQAIDSDIMMALDECPGYPCSREYAKKSLELTTRWAQRCLLQHRKGKKTQQLFGIVQGSTYRDLRVASARQITALGFDGYAIGGVANGGEPRRLRTAVLDWVVPYLPQNAPRYLMGVGRPEEILSAVQHGIDMFDCVIPTREARHGRLYLAKGPSLVTGGTVHYTTINITNAKFRTDRRPLNGTHLKKYSRAYLHHLFKSEIFSAVRLSTLHNLDFYLRLMAEIRKAIRAGSV